MRDRQASEKAEGGSALQRLQSGKGMHCSCVICGYERDASDRTGIGTVRGNTSRFLNRTFLLWKCPKCHSLHSVDPVDFEDIYQDYPLNKRRLDFFAKVSMGNLLRRLRRAGLGKTVTVLDYGCGNGLFVRFLQERGYERCVGYDPYVEGFDALPEHTLFDCVIANDVIEHVPDPRATVRRCVELLRQGGLLYIGTADSEDVDMADLEPHVMRLHQPFHRILVSQKTLEELGTELGLDLVASYRRSYMDTLVPFGSYRFLDEFSRALGHNMDLALDPSAGFILLRRPRLWFFAFFGYFFPSAYEPAVIFRKPLTVR